jgi:hypothetical protein
VVEVAGQSSAPSEAVTSYGRPNVTSLQTAWMNPSSTSAPAEVLDTEGASVVTISGTNLGPIGELVQVLLAGLPLDQNMVLRVDWQTVDVRRAAVAL